MSLEGKYDEAQDVIEEECLGNWTQAYLPLCDIDIKFNTKGCRAKEYKRILDMRPGQHAIVFKTYVTPSETTPVIKTKYDSEAKKIQNIYIYCQHVVRMA